MMVPSTASHFEHIVIGAGLTGLCVGYGLAGQGKSVLVLDDGDAALKSSRANFGVIWVQGKGKEFPAYGSWTRKAADQWPAFAAWLNAKTEMDIEYSRPGGLQYLLSEREFEDRGKWLTELTELGIDGSTSILDRKALLGRFPNAEFGDSVLGASYCPQDGEVNPLLLWRALHAGFLRLGGTLRKNAEVKRITRGTGGVEVEAAGITHTAASLVIAAGMGTEPLSRQVGIDIHVEPERGQLLITERTRPIVPTPAAGLRQFVNGTVMIGSSRDNVGLDISTTLDGCRPLVQRAFRIFPALGEINIVRSWAGLRSLTPDHGPVYQQNEERNVTVLLCHSGVTLAPLHCGEVATAIAHGEWSLDMQHFTMRRFH